MTMYIEINAIRNRSISDDELGLMMGFSSEDPEIIALQLEHWASQVRNRDKNFTPGPHCG